MPMEFNHYRPGSPERIRYNEALDIGIMYTANDCFYRSQDILMRESFDQGTLVSSGIPPHRVPSKEIIWRTGYTAPWAGHVNSGTKPHMPPHKPIFEWVWRHYSSFTATTSKGGELSPARMGANRARAIKRANTRTRREFMRGLKKGLMAAFKMLGAGRFLRMARMAMRAYRTTRKAFKSPHRDDKKVQRVNEIAWAIRLMIAKEGNTPTWFWKRSLAYARGRMGMNIQRAVSEVFY